MRCYEGSEVAERVDASVFEDVGTARAAAGILEGLPALGGRGAVHHVNVGHDFCLLVWGFRLRDGRGGKKEEVGGNEACKVASKYCCYLAKS